jgi:hypothetical protein
LLNELYPDPKGAKFQVRSTGSLVAKVQGLEKEPRSGDTILLIQQYFISHILFKFRKYLFLGGALYKKCTINNPQVIVF